MSVPRFVTAASLFDGHDAAINIMRRILQRHGAEVIHLGHDRSVDEVVEAAIAEDAHGIALSSYQGGHVEYFRYLVERLRAEGAGHVRVFGGGGGVISPAEVDELHAAGVTRIFTPEDGQRLGLDGMIDSMIAACDLDLAASGTSLEEVGAGSTRALARLLSVVEADGLDAATTAGLRELAGASAAPVLGITGTGGSGKSSLTDELVRRFRIDQRDELRIAVLAIDPTRRRGGALLGDRIRMNAIHSPQVVFRSLATRHPGAEVPDRLDVMIDAARVWGADLVIVETPGIGQGDAGIVEFADVSLYVMTPEFGAPTQLEKIDMLDFADVVAINKSDRRGGADALRAVARQLVRNRAAFDRSPDDMAVFPTVASRFDDAGVTELYRSLRDRLAGHGLVTSDGVLDRIALGHSADHGHGIVPGNRVRYLTDVADAVRSHHAATERNAAAMRQVHQLERAAEHLDAAGRDATGAAVLAAELRDELDPGDVALLAEWHDRHAELVGPDRPVRRSLAGTPVPNLALPDVSDAGDLLRWLRSEHLPGSFPYTAGVFDRRRDDEDPARMFAGEGGPARTNARFHLLAEGQAATRLSTAFDSVTLYGSDPAERPDIWGKIGNSGVSIATVDDMATLFEGFDLCDPSTSVSMTINGPAPVVLAMFLNVAIDQHPELDPAEVLERVRGTVQADILKEDQGQNTCIFSTDFALRMMADVAEWFVEHRVRRFYSVSISGYHIAEAGANPITQLAFTLANGFTYVEAYLARGLDIDDFAPNLSFFFSNGMDPEYNVLGRVARRIWAIAMRDHYGANPRSQRLKYHVQTSGRSLHAQEMAFNDIRTTLQALCAIADNANSLHTNAYDEALTTPTAESVRRALAIQLIIGREWGLTACENPLQGSFVITELTDLVESAVLDELDRISERGGVLGAMETGYQRGRIQDESMHYEHAKHDGSLPIVGVNTFVAPDADAPRPEVDLARSSDAEKRERIEAVAAFRSRHAHEGPAALDRLRHAALAGDNLFDVLMETVRHCTLGEITGALFDVGGEYRRNV